MTDRGIRPAQIGTSESAFVRPLRIALVAGWYYPESVGGTEAYVHGLARELQSRGHQPVVAAPWDRDDEQRYTFDGVPVYRYPAPATPAGNSQATARDPVNQSPYAAWLRHLQPDIVHVHSITGGVSVEHALMARSLGSPLVLTAHVPGLTCARGTLLRWGHEPCDGLMDASRCGACYLQQRGLPRTVAKAIVQVPAGLDRLAAGRLRTVLGARQGFARHIASTLELLDATDHFIVVSDWLREVLAVNGISADRITVSRHGLPPDLMAQLAQARRRRLERWGTPITRLRVGFMGRFTPLKGAHVLVEAVRRIPRSVPLDLVLYGRTNVREDTAYLSMLRRAAADEPRITFGGEMTDTNREAALADLDLLAVPSTWFESGPLVVLEAFAAGLPVLGSDCGGIAELVRPGAGGLLAPTGIAAAWAPILEELARHPASVQPLATAIPAVRSTGHVAEDTLQVYGAALNRHLARPAAS